MRNAEAALRTAEAAGDADTIRHAQLALEREVREFEDAKRAKEVATAATVEEDTVVSRRLCFHFVFSCSFACVVSFACCRLVSSLCFAVWGTVTPPLALSSVIRTYDASPGYGSR